jgi:hypothetical protein
MRNTTQPVEAPVRWSAGSRPPLNGRLNGVAAEHAAYTASCGGRTRGENRWAFGAKTSPSPVR